MSVLHTSSSSFRGILGAAVLAGALLLGGAGSAHAIEFESFGVEVMNADGTPARQAGSHPNMRVRFSIPTEDPNDPLSSPIEQSHRFQLDLPPGTVGNPQLGPTCPDSGMQAAASGNVAACPVGSQVGYAVVSMGAQGDQMVPVFNMERPLDAPAEFAFNVIGVIVKIKPSVRPGDHGISVDSGVIASAAQITSSDVTLWGVPADPANDRLRVSYGGSLYCPGGTCYNPPVASQAERKPFLTLPTSCPGTADTVVARLDGWKTQGTYTSRSVSSDLNDVPLVTTGCERLAFAPTVSTSPTSQRTDAPSGLEVDLRVPQSDAPDGLATAHVKDVEMLLPQGMSVSPSSALGLGACSPAQIALDTTDVPSCPRSSKLGSVTVQTPVLEEPLTGDVILATPNLNPFGSLVALYIVAEGSGVRIKLPGRVDMNPVSGQLTATFKNNPQLPFSRLRVRFDGGANASLATPTSCGRYDNKTSVSSWSGKSVQLTSPMVIDQGCGERGFAPGFSAGVANPASGKSSPFSLIVARADGQQELRSIKTVQLPEGLLADVGSVPLCGEADAAAGTCPASSRVGRVEVAAGPGSAPVWLPQAGKAPTSVSLTGPYKGAPYGLSIVVPAQAGPFDLGAVVVRSALWVDPRDAHVTVQTDDMPYILQGIPLRVREVRVVMDRSGFMLNPTSCTPKQITATLASVSGQTAEVSSRFQVGECAQLPLKPNLSLALSGKGQTTDGKHPAVSAVLTQKQGESNLRKVRVALPLSLALDPDNANGLCEFVDGSKVEPTCPKASIVGTATAVTPILNAPLTGPVYFVKNIRIDAKSGRQIKTLPKLVIPLVGPNGVKLMLTGTSAVEKDRLVTTFENIPDAPVSSFKLNIIGGKGGILTVSDADICKATQVAYQQVDGQNGKDADASISMQTPSCPLKVVSKKVGKGSVAVKVSGLGAGKVTVSGRGIRKTTKTISKSTVATITARRTKGAPAKVTVTFDPVGPAKARKVTK